MYDPSFMTFRKWDFSERKKNHIKNNGFASFTPTVTKINQSVTLT